MFKSILLILMMTNAAFAAEAVLKDVSTAIKNGKATIEYTFENRVDPRKVSFDFINDTIQLDVPNAFIEEKKRFTDVEDEKIKNLYSYQISKDTLRLRINYKPGNNAADFENAVATSFVENKMIVTIDDGRVPMKPVANLPEKRTINVVKVEDLTGEIETTTNVTDQKTNETLAVASLANKETNAESEPVTITSEEDIPVLQSIPEVESKKSGTTLFRIISSFVILGLFAFGMFLLNRKWSKTKLKNPHTHIKVLTQHYIGPKKSLAIIRVAGESILIGVTENNISLIKELSLLDDDLPQEVPENFDSSMDEADQNYEQEERFGKEQDNFSISGIKDIVKTRLKTMRDL